MSLPDVRTWPAAVREEAAWRAHETDEVDPFPDLKYYNSDPCPAHETSDPLCDQCGLPLRRHQKAAATWQFFGMATHLADAIGSGKTATACATLAMCKETGELSPSSRAVVVAQPAAVRDPWAKDLHRLLPGIPFIVADGTPAQRQRAYLSPWEVCVISDRTFAPSRGGRDGDIETLLEFPVRTLIYDDLDPMRHRTTATAHAIRRFAARCPRRHGLHGTPLQKRLAELYCFTEPIGSSRLFGTLNAFKQRYVTQREEKIWVPAILCPGGMPCDRHEFLLPDCRECGKVHRWPPPQRICPVCRQQGHRDPTGRARAQLIKYVDNGVKADRLPEFQRAIAPLVLRRTAFTDVDLPEVQYQQVWLSFGKPQRDRYAELRKGVLKRLKDGREEITQAVAAAAWTRGAQICSGLASLEDRDISVKLDWLIDMLTGDLSEEKIVAYVHYTDNVAALSARLDACGIGHVLFWSRETNSQLRESRRHQFLTDPQCRVLVGTTTIERSLNLQAAGHMVLVDTIMNASRMQQLVGRVRRQGSRHRMVMVHHLLIEGTQEQSYPALLQREEQLADDVWDERAAMFRALSPVEAMEVIAGRV